MSVIPGAHATKIGWIGFHVEGIEPLRTVLRNGFPIEAVLTLEPELAATQSGAADYRSLCDACAIPIHFVRDVNDERSQSVLRELALDIVFVIGWTQLVGPATRSLARIGMIGAHASLLPELRGRAPVNWALIRGLRQTGNSLMWLADGADRGDIIDQTVIPISPYDTCASLYERVAASNTAMILRVIPELLNGRRPGRPQTHTDAPVLPRRRPEDGVIDWSGSSEQVYNFVRALTRPYPGARSCFDHRQYLVWEAALLPGHCRTGVAPGEVVGVMVSPRQDACGIVVACGTGTLALLELEDDDGRILSGRALAELPWAGKQWRIERE